MRNSLKARVVLVLALALPVAILVAASASARPSPFPQGDITITVFGSDELPQFQIEQGLIDEWTKLHPNVKVEAQQAPLGPAFQKLSTELPSGGGPTIFSVFEPWIEGFSRYMAPAKPEAFGLSSMKALYNLYLPNSLQAQSRGGRVLCLPSAAPAWSLLVNRKKFTAAGLKIPQDVPRTWSQVAALQEKLTKHEGRRLVQRGFGIRYTAGPHWYAMLFVAAVQSQGAKVIAPNGRPLLTSPAAQRAMSVFRDNAVEPTVSKAVQTSPYQDFASGLDVMSYGGANAISFVTRLNPSMKGNVYVSQMPSLNGKPGGAPKYSFDYCVNKNASADEQYAAWSLIDYITKRGVLLWKETGAIQPRKNFFANADVKKMPFISVHMNELAHAQALPQTKYWDQLQTAIANGVQKVVFKKEPIKDALAAAQAEYLQSIRK